MHAVVLLSIGLADASSCCSKLAASIAQMLQLCHRRALP